MRMAPGTRAVRYSRQCLTQTSACVGKAHGLGALDAGFSRGLPYFGKRGLNAGVLLVSLQRLREADFGRERDRIIRHFFPKKALPLGDQDVLNAYLHKYPQHVHVVPCTFNFRSDSACYDGFPVILHGNRGLKDDLNSTYSSLYRLMGTLMRAPVKSEAF